jgi:hypothetical protein
MRRLYRNNDLLYNIIDIVEGWLLISFINLKQKSKGT